MNLKHLTDNDDEAKELLALLLEEVGVDLPQV